MRARKGNMDMVRDKKKWRKRIRVVISTYVERNKDKKKEENNTKKKGEMHFYAYILYIKILYITIRKCNVCARIFYVIILTENKLAFLLFTIYKIIIIGTYRFGYRNKLVTHDINHVFRLYFK